MGPRAGLDGCGKSHSHRDSITGPSSQHRVHIRTELSWPTPPGLKSKKFCFGPLGVFAFCSFCNGGGMFTARYELGLLFRFTFVFIGLILLSDEEL